MVTVTVITVIPLLIDLLERAPVVSIVRLVAMFGIANMPRVACQALPCGRDTLGSLPGSLRGAEESDLGQPRARQIPYRCAIAERQYIYLLFGSHPAIHRGYSWLCTQELLLAVLGGPYGMLGVEPGLAACNANALPTVLQP